MNLRFAVAPLFLWSAMNASACHRRQPDASNTPRSAPVIANVPPLPTNGSAPGISTPVPVPSAGPAAPPAPVAAAITAPQTQTASGLTITSSNPVLFRWQDGDWVFRASYFVRNNGTTPIDFDRASLRIADWNGWDNGSTLAEHSTVNPGLTIAGDVAWYYGGSNPQPASVTVNYAPGTGDTPAVLSSRTFQPVFSPAPPGNGTAPTALVYSLPVSFAAPGLTFVHTDGDRTVRFTVSITNTTGAPLRIPLDYFHAKIGTDDGSRWGAVTTLNDPLDVAPGATATGAIGWYWSGDHGVPPNVNLSFGPANSPQFNSAVAVSPGPSPVQ